MAAGSLLALLARHSLLPVRQNSKLAAAKVVQDVSLIDLERPAQVTHAQVFVEQQPADEPLFSSFHIDLAERLQQLQLQGAGNLHLNWLLDALASTLSTHSALQSALIGAAATSAASLPKHRADEVLSLLDVCTALKQVAEAMESQFGWLQRALQSVGHALNSEEPLSSGRLRAATHRLSVCLQQDGHQPNMLYILADKLLQRRLAEARSSLLLAAQKELQGVASPDPAATLLNQALDGAILTSLLVLAAAVSSLAPPSRRKSSGIIACACKMTLNKYLGAKGVSAPWAAPLRQLHRDLRQEDMSAAGGALFQELQGIHSAVSKLHAAITSPAAHSTEHAVVKQSVESLKKILREVQSCTTMFRVQMASFFQALIALRLALLQGS